MWTLSNNHFETLYEQMKRFNQDEITDIAANKKFGFALYKETGEMVYSAKYNDVYEDWLHLKDNIETIAAGDEFALGSVGPSICFFVPTEGTTKMRDYKINLNELGMGVSHGKVPKVNEVISMDGSDTYASFLVHSDDEASIDADALDDTKLPPNTKDTD